MLAEQAPDLREALNRAREEGFAHVILDGKIIACDRCKEPARSVRGEAIDLWYSGKAHTHGGNIQAVLAPDGFPLWVSGVESLRCLGERGFALLTGRWRALQHITLSPSKIGDIARAALVLTHFEHGYIA